MSGGDEVRVQIFNPHEANTTSHPGRRTTQMTGEDMATGDMTTPISLLLLHHPANIKLYGVGNQAGKHAQLGWYAPMLGKLTQSVYGSF